MHSSCDGAVSTPTETDPRLIYLGLNCPQNQICSIVNGSDLILHMNFLYHYTSAKLKVTVPPDESCLQIL
jgi:hypothetical protein